MPSRFRPKSTRSSAARSQRSLPAMGDQLHSRDRAKAGRSKCEGRNYRARAEFWRGMEPRHRGIDVTKMPANKAFSQSRGPRAGHARSRRSFAPILATKQSYLQDVFSGSDGTRTRELRRDRPVLALPGRAGLGGDSRREQSFRYWRCGNCPELAEFPATSRGMSAGCSVAGSGNGAGCWEAKHERSEQAEQPRRFTRRRLGRAPREVSRTARESSGRMRV